MPRSRTGTLLLTILIAGCDLYPTAPAEMGISTYEETEPNLSMWVRPGGGTRPLHPLPGANDVTIVSEGNGGYVGSSGGRPALWNNASVPIDLAPLDEATGVLEYRRHYVVGAMDGRAAQRSLDFPWNQPVVVDLGTLPGHDRSRATALSAFDQEHYVVGDSWADGEEAQARAFVWNGTTMSELPPLPGHVSSRALSVTWAGGGTVAGLSYPAGGGPAEIVIWTNGVPTSIGFDDDRYFAHGIETPNDGAFIQMFISARAGNEVLRWGNGVLRTWSHPDPSNPAARYWVTGAHNSPDLAYELEVNEPLVSRRFGRPDGDGGPFLTSVLPISGCTLAGLCTGPTRQYPMSFRIEGSGPLARVNDLTVTANGSTSIAVAWTQIADDMGEPARYRVRYLEAPFPWHRWKEGKVGCDVVGTAIGTEGSCILRGLHASKAYDILLMSYRLDDSTWVNTSYSNLAVGQTGWAGGGGPPPPGEPGVVSDLSATGRTASTVSLSWTQVDDGTGAPAKYRVKYAEPSIDWRTATIGCSPTIDGTAIGTPMSCTVQGLSASTQYEFLLMSYRVENGAWINARYSNLASATTTSGALQVTDLSIAGVSRTSVTVRWTEIDDGTGNPASYRVKYHTGGGFKYATATTFCTIPGTEIGGTLACTAEGLEPNVPYEFQLMSYRVENGVWVDTHKSNITAATTLSF